MLDRIGMRSERSIGREREIRKNISQEDPVEKRYGTTVPGQGINKREPSRRIGIIMNTPGQVHFYRHIRERLMSDGHRVHVLARDYGETVDLLLEFGIPHEIYSTPGSSRLGKLFTLPMDVLKVIRILKREGVGIVTGFGVYDALSSTILGIPNVVFSDMEPGRGLRSYWLQFNLCYPFVDHIITPAHFTKDLGTRQLRINGMKENAYLHPSIYRPDDSVLDLLGVSKDEKYSLLRFNGLDAFHDLGVGGFSVEHQRMLVRELERFGPVFISSERPLPPDLEERLIRIPKGRIHDAMYHASLLVTDTGTMATEAALLGTPAVRYASYVGTEDMGNFIELETKYGLLSNFDDPLAAIRKAVDLMAHEDSKQIWIKRKELLMNESVDMTKLMTWLLEGHPESLRMLQEGPAMQGSFRTVKPVDDALHPNV